MKTRFIKPTNVPIFLVYDLRVIRSAPPLSKGTGLEDDDPVYLMDRRLLARANGVLRAFALILPAKFNADMLVGYIDDIIADESYEQSFDPNGKLVGERVCINERALDGLIALLCEEVTP